MKDPAFLLYYQDFIVGTQFMTLAEKGAYITILCHLADKGSLSRREIDLICGDLSFDEVLKDKFELTDDGRFYHKRLAMEVKKRQRFVDSRRANAASKNTRSICSASEKHMHMHMEDENENKDLKDKSKQKKEKSISTSINNKEKSSIINLFDNLWSNYPNKAGKKHALKHFMATVKTPEDEKAIKVALEHYLNSKRVHRGYVQNGSTWFNNWQDWVEYTEDFCKKCGDKGVFTSKTGYEVVCECQKNQ